MEKEVRSKREGAMTVDPVRVAVNGYGIIGKRVADAIKLQPDMELVGVGDVVSDYRVKAAVVHELPIYASLPEKVGEMQAGVQLDRPPEQPPGFLQLAQFQAGVSEREERPAELGDGEA